MWRHPGLVQELWGCLICHTWFVATGDVINRSANFGERNTECGPRDDLKKTLNGYEKTELASEKFSDGVHMLEASTSVYFVLEFW
ncbi:hypothetical protein Aperf_G00000012386 [Anoplocephala perfoliata]